MMSVAEASGSKEALADIKWMKKQASIMVDIALYNTSKTKSKGSK